MGIDKDLEEEIVSKGLTAPRVTLELIESRIVWEYYVTGDQIVDFTTPQIGNGNTVRNMLANSDRMSCLTICVLLLTNGFTVTGVSAPAPQENFDAALGRKVARQDAVGKIWLLEGYVLRQRLHDEESIHRTEDRS